jgi:hypothetical protein
LSNGGFGEGLAAWAFRSEPGDGGVVPATYRVEQQWVNDELVWTIGLERWGGNRDRNLATAVLFQDIQEDLSMYRSVHLSFDLRVNYQSLPGGGPVGTDYPFAVRIRYQDADGKERQYLYGFYYRTEQGYPNEPASGGEATEFPHYRWERVSLDLFGIEPPPELLTGIDLVASGHDYSSWVANLSLVAD